MTPPVARPTDVAAALAGATSAPPANAAPGAQPAAAGRAPGLAAELAEPLGLAPAAQPGEHAAALQPLQAKLPVPTLLAATTAYGRNNGRRNSPRRNQHGGLPAASTGTKASKSPHTCERRAKPSPRGCRGCDKGEGRGTGTHLRAAGALPGRPRLCLLGALRLNTALSKQTLNDSHNRRCDSPCCM
ncbi:hypothetical protein FIBSPDRAFT_952496 [Athelia psychrophila]|uniref:Uncharacterized protein n=1 Tax=Athelia psychrophila TaxID=1759441 RepID=A0A166LGE6_9AGAM|nr:hypothetical protein FIBSPDRAFT_952496 [Fibularhizoctonia sp. CBS 109695]